MFKRFVILSAVECYEFRNPDRIKLFTDFFICTESVILHNRKQKNINHPFIGKNKPTEG